MLLQISSQTGISFRRVNPQVLMLICEMTGTNKSCFSDASCRLNHHVAPLLGFKVHSHTLTEKSFQLHFSLPVLSLTLLCGSDSTPPPLD